MEPLFRACYHGCNAGCFEEAYELVYVKRIQQAAENEDKDFCVETLGAVGSELAVQTAFFGQPWDSTTLMLGSNRTASLLNSIANNLWALGRLGEAIKLYGLSLEHAISRAKEPDDWVSASWVAVNTAMLLIDLGDLREAQKSAEQAVDLADRSGNAEERADQRGILAAVLHNLGNIEAAESLFRESENLNPDPQNIRLLSVRRYYDFILTGPESTAWQLSLGEKAQHCLEDCVTRCERVQRIAADALKLSQKEDRKLRIAYDNLALCRAGFAKSLYSVLGVNGQTARLDASAKTFLSESHTQL